MYTTHYGMEMLPACARDFRGKLTLLKSTSLLQRQSNFNTSIVYESERQKVYPVKEHCVFCQF